MIGDPVHAAGKARSTKKPARTKQVSSTKKEPAGKATSGTSDYKSKYREKTPPPGGGRPRIQKQKRPDGYKPKEREKKYNDFTGGDRPSRRKEPAPPPRPRADHGHEPVVIIHPPIHDDVIFWDWYPLVYDGPYVVETAYEDPYLEPEPSASAVETASLLFAATSVAINYAFIREGQIGEFAAGAGFVFGLASLASASQPNARHPILGYLLGGASIAFAVWNLAGGMDQLHTYDHEPIYDYSVAPNATFAPAGVAAGWSFTF